MDVNTLTFGVEIETHVPHGALTVGRYHGRTRAEGLPEGWRTMSDCSINAPRGRTGCEFVSPILKGSEGVRNLMEAVAKINELGARVNASCGVHVHVGWTGDAAALARLITLVANFERAIYATTGSTNRENGNWCRGVHRNGNAAAAINSARCNRYHVLNLTNLASGRQATVEFRAFSGSTNLVKILGYVRLCLGLVERALSVSRKTNWTAKKPVPTSPIARKGEGHTALTRLFYQLGWTKGRTSHTYGDVTAEGAPEHKAIKREFVRLAKQYDGEQEALARYRGEDDADDNPDNITDAIRHAWRRGA